MIIWCTSMAFGGAAASFSVPAASHSFSSVTSMDIIGLGLNPASAVSTTRQLSFDIGLLLFAIDVDLAAPEQDLVEERYGSLPEGWGPIRGNLFVQGVSPSPNFSMRLPFQTFGLGWSVFLPYATGGAFDERGIQRYFSTEGRLVFLENNVSLAKSWSFGSANIQLGLSARHMYGTAKTQSSSDTGTLIHGLSGDDGLILDPLMEGVRFASGTGQAMGYGVGVHVEYPKFSLHASYRSSIPISLLGDFENQLSTSLTVAFQGSSSINVVLPQELYLGSTIALKSNIRLRLDAGGVDWSQYRYMRVTADDIEVVSDSVFFQEILDSYGLTTNDLITADQNILVDNGMHASYFGRIGIDVQVHETVELRSRVGYSTAAVPIEYMTLSNGDYPTLQLDMGGIWSPSSRCRFALNLLYLGRGERVVEPGMSVYSPYQDPQEGRVGLSGEGRYRFKMGRVGLSTIVDF